MREKLIELLGLDAKATEDQIVSTVKALTEENKARSVTNDREKAIQKKIAESGGALNREMAVMALEHQADHDAKRKGTANKR